MKTLFRLLIALWVKQPIYKRIPWSRDDQQSLTLFLQSGSGKRFILKLREAAADISFRSVYGKSNEAVSNAGYARGFCDSLGLVFRLAKSFPLQESEYEVAESQTLPGQPAEEREQDWRGSMVGSGGAIAPNLEF